MHMFDIFSEEDFQKAVDAKLITSRPNTRGDLEVLNYSKSAMTTKGAWDNPAVLHCRGLVVEKGSGAVVARPYKKFFNHGQPEAGEPDFTSPVEVTDKLDGSLLVIFQDPTTNLVECVTRGSFASDQAIAARAWLQENFSQVFDPLLWEKGAMQDLTLLGEWISPDNRIVVDYGGYEGVKLLGAVGVGTGEYYGPHHSLTSVWTGSRTDVFEYETLGDALKAEPRQNAEGFVVRYLSHPHMVKIKQGDYLRLHKIVTGLSEKTLWEWRVDNPWNVAGLEKFLEPLPDEFHQWVRDMDAALQDQWEWFLHQTQGLGPQMEAASYGDRKQYAKLVSKVEDRRLIPLLFSWKDGKPLHETIMRYIKPGGVTKVWTGP